MTPIIRFNDHGLLQVGPNLYEPDGYDHIEEMMSDIYWERYNVYDHKSITGQEAGDLAARDATSVVCFLQNAQIGLFVDLQI